MISLLVGVNCLFAACGHDAGISGSKDSSTDEVLDLHDSLHDTSPTDTTEAEADSTETHDAIDEDTDEPDGVTCLDGMVHIVEHGFCIDAFEASRPDATSTHQGTEFGPARSVPGVIPWTIVTWSDASEACRLAGKHLCTQEDWLLVCSHDGDLAYPYGPDYDEEACWGDGSGATAPRRTGSRPFCEGGYPGVLDMSGNCSEWLSDCDTYSGTCTVAYSYYRASPEQMACNEFSNFEADSVLLSHGFRCCIAP
jgi:hypothetical protein